MFSPLQRLRVTLGISMGFNRTAATNAYQTCWPGATHTAHGGGWEVRMARSVLLAVIAGAALLGLVRPAQAQAQSKVAVIVMENKAYTKIVGSRTRPISTR